MSYLIDELITANGSERVKEEKNVRRRAYDAINVLIAAGVLEKDGNNVVWRKECNAVELEETRMHILEN